MPIVSEMMKIIDERKTRKNKQTNKQTNTEKNKGDKNCSEKEVRAKSFCIAFKLGFLQ